MTIKITVNLTQYDNPQRTAKNNDKYVYFVESVQNTTDPAPGEKLSMADVNSLIAARATVNIRKHKP